MCAYKLGVLFPNPSPNYELTAHRLPAGNLLISLCGHFNLTISSSSLYQAYMQFLSQCTVYTLAKNLHS